MRFMVLVGALVATAASAQSERLNTTPRPATQTVDFGDGDLIDGTRALGLGDIYIVPPHPKFPSLIKVRMNFNDKLRESVHEM